MLLSKTYSYINANGDRESTPHKMSPSNLRRANVPDDLIAEYDSANSRLQAVASNLTFEDDEIRNQQLDDLNRFRAEKDDALSAIKDFLSHQEMLNFGTVDIQAIQRLLHSEITAHKIEKDTGISRTTIGNIKNGKADLLNISLKNALILSQYALSKGV